ncbi:hypothetical protein EWM64_g206 [Hericium alpestre]|uniref:Uncharacterized protein n=1 Tax=Hericium alpestre TaxID=135208 RepID=A0A4Z0ABQ2_9AGAM|nr:hypothetical protein EWM64_g206 [Hericium alpestre]
MQLDAASTLISPPPEDSFRQGARSQSRFDSEPAQSRYSPGQPSSPPNAVAGSSTKRKRSAAPSNANLRAAAIAEEDDPTAFVNASPNPKARKQKRRSPSPVSPRPTSPQHPQSVQCSPPRARASAHPATSPLQNAALARVRQGSRARSSTPVPVYEPPTERFTPPREVVLTPSPRVSKSSKRKSVGKAPRLKLVIKKELPEIDLSKPAPPPSPTDDPLLLHGRPRTSKTPAKARVTPPLASSPPERAMPPPPPRHLDFSVPASDDLPRYEEPQPEVAEEHNDLPDDQDELPDPGPVFDFSNAGGADDGWSSSDNEPEPEPDAFDGTGEFTGKFRMMSVPTKVDPPTSATRERIESWGRPISPFPKKWKGKEKMVVEEDEAEDEVLGGLEEDTEMTDEMDGGEPDDGDIHEEEPPQDEGSDGIEESMPPPRHSASPAPPARFSASPRPSASLERSHSPVQQRPSPSPSHAHKSPSPSLPPASPTVEGSPDEDEDDVPVASFDHVERTASPSAPGSPDHPHDSGFEEDAQGENSSQEGRRPVQMDSSPILPASTVAHTSPIPVIREKSVEEEEMEEELSVDRELSEEPQPDRGVDEHGLRLTDEVMFKAEHDVHRDEPFGAVVDELDEEDTSDEDPGDLSVIKIVSDDPWAAARAAAILKSHDYDWHTKIERPRRRQSSIRSPSVDSRIRNTHRASAVGAGIAKFSSPAEKAHRRNMLAIGLEKTVMLPEAEADIVCSSASPAHGTRERNAGLARMRLAQDVALDIGDGKHAGRVAVSTDSSNCRVVHTPATHAHRCA